MVNFLLLEDKEVIESTQKLNKYLDTDGKKELGKLLSMVYQHGYVDCINDIASQNHFDIVGIGGRD